MSEILRLLGMDHCDFGHLHAAAQAEGRTAAAISPGGEAVRVRKIDLPIPNEDAALAIDDGPYTLLAVADGHHGYAASHELLAALAERPVPRDPLALLATLRHLLLPPDDADPEARSTLLIAIWDRLHARGFGLSFADSSLYIVSPHAPPATPARKDRAFVSPWDPPSLDPRRAQEFAFTADPGDLLVAFTDGIDECHYGRPETSVRPEHLWNLLAEAGPDPLAYARALGGLALRGVAGQPGGEDNLALAVTRA